MNFSKAIFIITILISFQSLGQDVEEWTLFPKKDSNNKKQQNVEKKLSYNKAEGSLTLNQDTRIDSLTLEIAETPYVDGYTVQIAVSQQKTVLNEARKLFMEQFAEYDLIDQYKVPNTYLYAGVFYTRADAYAFKHKLRNAFPEAIVIQKKMPLPNMETTDGE